MNIGHNGPPSPINIADEMRQELSRFLASHPIIESIADAKHAAQLETQGLRSLQEMEDERKLRVGGLTSQVSAINTEYRIPREALTSTRVELGRRLNDYMRVQRLAHEEQAEKAMAAAQEKERVADEAARLAQEGIEEARQGVIGIQVGDLIATAAKAHHEAARAHHEAAIAERETTVRINPGLGGKSRGLREQETLEVVDVVAAIGAIGVTAKIRDAILTGARAYRVTHKRLPPGVTAEPPSPSHQEQAA